MARYEHLPIYRAAFDLAVHMEKIVKKLFRASCPPPYGPCCARSKLFQTILSMGLWPDDMYE